MGLRGRPLAATQRLLRRRRRGRGARRRLARGRRRSTARRRGRRRGTMTVRVRNAEPGDAAVLVALANAVGAEPEGWLLTDSAWRSASDERRYLRAVRRHPDAAVLVAEDGGDVVGRLSISRDPH